MKKTTKSIGDEAENQAANFLIEKGFIILESNFRHRRGEIDLICKKADLMVFVEVKFRISNAYGFPEESIDHKKEERIRQTATYYLEQTNHSGNIRFDIIAISGQKKSVDIQHFEDAF